MCPCPASIDGAMVTGAFTISQILVDTECAAYKTVRFVQPLYKLHCGAQGLGKERKMVVTHQPLEDTADGVIHLGVFRSPRHIRYLK